MCCTYENKYYKTSMFTDNCFGRIADEIRCILCVKRVRFPMCVANIVSLKTHTVQRNRISPISRSKSHCLGEPERSAVAHLCTSIVTFEEGKESKLETVNFYFLIVRRTTRKKIDAHTRPFQYYCGNERTLSTDFARYCVCNAKQRRARIPNWTHMHIGKRRSTRVPRSE